jgi:hypothetical protein
MPLILVCDKYLSGNRLRKRALANLAEKVSFWGIKVPCACRNGLLRSCLFLSLAVLVASNGCRQEVTTPPVFEPDPSQVASEARRDRVDRVLDAAFVRPLDLKVHAAWQIVHGAMAFKKAYQVKNGGDAVFILDYLLKGGSMSGWTFMPGVVLDPATGRRGLISVMEPGSKSGQGHADQWLGYLSNCGFQLTDPITSGGVNYTFEDYVRQIEWDVPQNAIQEYSWTLMSLTAYRPTSHSWQASDGQTWSIERLLEIELDQIHADQFEIRGPCGGTHRLFGVAIALKRHRAQGGELTGAWEQAQKEIEGAINLARTHQNADGSLSTNFFIGRPGISVDLGQNLHSTGHTFEFLAVALPQEELEKGWVTLAADSLCEMFEDGAQLDLECGALYHAAHGLVVYRERMWGLRPFGGIDIAGTNFVGPAEKAPKAPQEGQNDSPK